MRINFDRLLDYMMEKDGEYNEYRRLCEVYKKAHRVPYVEFIRGIYSEELEEIKMRRKYFDRSEAALDAVVEVAGFDKEQLERLYDIYKGVKKWYEKTEWKRCLPEELLERIEVYVVG